MAADYETSKNWLRAELHPRADPMPDRDTVRRSLAGARRPSGGVFVVLGGEPPGFLGLTPLAVHVHRKFDAGQFCECSSEDVVWLSRYPWDHLVWIGNTVTRRAEVAPAFNWGIRAGLIADNPAAGMVRRAKAPERRELTANERHKLMSADGPCADYWRLYLLTGMRRSELVSITIDGVHLDTPAPFVDVVGKGLKKRSLPLEGLALEIFARLVRVARENHTLRVCPLSGDAIGHRWDRDRIRLGLPRSIRLHDLRHDFISVLANSGTPLPVVQRLAGHTQLATTATYIHDDPAALRAAMIDRSRSVQR